MNFDKITSFLKKHWLHILILVLIFLVALGFRTMILRYDLLFEFDSYYHARMNSYVIDTAMKPFDDFIGSYHAIKTGIFTEYNNFWAIGYLAYKIVYFGAAYTQDNWLALVRYLPAIYGALTALAAYLLFRWAFNSRKIGYIAGFVTGVMPAFVYRTMGGWYEPTSMGFLWMMLGFAFLIKAIEKPDFKISNYIYAGISGLMFGIMAFIWKAFAICPVVLEGFIVLYLLWLLIKKTDKKTILAVLSILALAFVVMAVIATISSGTSWVNEQVSQAAGILGLNHDSVNTQTSGSVIGAGVGEESMGKDAFPMKYGMFLPFIILGLIAFGYSLYKNKYAHIGILTFVWGLLYYYLAWNKLKATFYFGIALAIVSAFTIAMLIKYFEEDNKSKKEINWKVAGACLMVFLLIGGTASGVIFTYNNVPNIISEQGWVDALSFMKNSLPDNAKMFNWWSWGHWISYMGHKRVSTDNTNSDVQADTDFGTFFLTKDSNEALGIIKAYDADYVVVNYDSLMEMQTYASYANTIVPNKFNTKEIVNMPFSCQPEQNLGTMSFNCVSLFYMGNQRVNTTFDAQKMFSFAQDYTTKPTDIWQNRLPVIYYTTINKSLLLVVDMKTNESYGIKLWFNAPETKPYFSEVYTNGFVRIWKVNKDAFKNVALAMTGKTEKQVEEYNSKLWWIDQNTEYPIAPKQ